MLGAPCSEENIDCYFGHLSYPLSFLKIIDSFVVPYHYSSQACSDYLMNSQQLLIDQFSASHTGQFDVSVHVEAYEALTLITSASSLITIFLAFSFAIIFLLKLSFLTIFVVIVTAFL